jgi:NDP-sugar pyrophosphorylase family protein
MRAVILAGGLGTRLRPYTTVIPKPLVPVGDRPVLEHIVGELSAAGVTHVDLCVNHLGDLIQVYFSRVPIPFGVEFAFHWEDEPLGTAGALRMVPDLYETQTFFVMNGDVLTNLDYADLLRFHQEQDATVTIAMHAKRVRIDLGVIQHKEGFVYGYMEKPTYDYQVSMGVYVYERRALDYIPDGPCQFPELVHRLLEAGEKVAAYKTGADWFDIGTLEEYERASQAVELAPERFRMHASRTNGRPTQAA